MRVLIVAVGKLKSGPEAALTDDYLARANASGRALALHPFDLIEIDTRAGNDPRKEAQSVLRATPDESVKVLLDERGTDIGSRQLSQKLAAWRDQGRTCVTFWIGGADGASQTLKDQADEKIAFGRQTWPHKLVRAMLAEQLYRASTILGHSPYHRD